MKRLLVVLVALCALFSFLTARAVDTCPPPRCVEDAVPTSLLVPDARIRVILPQGYDASGATTYPVLYLIHGAGDDFTTWTSRTDVLELTRGLNLIMVMPDGGRNANAGWYSDWADGSRQWETFHTRDLVSYVEAKYHGNGRRGVAGLSMGGFGAMHDAARHPGLYRVAASFSGAVDTMYAYPASGPGFKVFHDSFGTPDDRVWGNQLADEARWRANNPTDLAGQLAGTKLLVATGNGLAGGAHEDPANPGGYAIENVIWQMNLDFVRALDAAHVPHTDLFYGPGQHSWPYWRDALSWALPQIAAALA